MSGATTGITGILLVFWMVVVWIGYHKIFSVTYFNLGKGLLSELIGAFLAGTLLAGLTIKLYWLLAIIVFVAGWIISSKEQDKSRKNTMLVIFAVLAIIVFIIGGNANKEVYETNEATEETAELNTIDPELFAIG